MVTSSGARCGRGGTITGRVPSPGMTNPASVGESADWTGEARALCADLGSTCSNLSAVGDPIEWQFVWSVDDGSLDPRVTVDPIPRGTARARVDRCLSLAPRLTPDQGNRARSLVAAQGVRARYGGWIGTRLRGGAFRRKLYLEMPHDFPWKRWWGGGEHSLGALPIPTLTPTMAGFDAVADGAEIYGKCTPLSLDALSVLCSALGRTSAAREGVAILCEARQQHIAARLPTTSQGFSLALNRRGRLEAITWYAYCEDLLGPAPRARNALLAIGASQDWDMRAYERMSAPGESGAVPWHGVIGLTVSRQAGVQFSASCSTRSEPN